MRYCQLISFLIACVVLPNVVFAGDKSDFPFSGYFSQQTSETQSGFKQALCAFAFFKKSADGRVVDYVLDLQRFEHLHQLHYIQSQTSQCDYDSKTNSDQCTKMSLKTRLPTGLKSFEYIENPNGVEPSLRVFGQQKELDAMLKAKRDAGGNFNQPLGYPILLHRCTGFSDATLARFIDDVTPLNPASMQLHYAMGFDKKRIPDALRIMEEISPEAFNATLPGQ